MKTIIVYHKTIDATGGRRIAFETTAYKTCRAAVAYATLCMPEKKAGFVAFFAKAAK